MNNRLPSPMINHVSPFSKLFGHSPLYYDLHTFGYVCLVHLPSHERHKLTSRSVKCVFLDSPSKLKLIVILFEALWKVG